MEKNERLLDLIAFFLDAEEPISWSELREAFPEAYGEGAKEALNRKFERDKGDLADLGVILEFQPGTDNRKEGYVLKHDGYYLPPIDFEPEEMAVLYAAGSAALASGAFPGRADLANALRKIAFGSGQEPESLPSRVFADLGKADEGAGERLETLWRALVGRKRVTIVYKGIGRDQETTREVDPWGLCLRRGVWVLQGFCHLRGAPRTFVVSRIAAVALTNEKRRLPEFEVPEGFRIEDVAAEQVWEHRFHPPIEVELRLSGALASLAGRLFPKAKVEQDGDAARVRVQATYLDGLLRRVLPLGESAVVVGPERARARLRELAEAVLAKHGGRGEEAA
jgi:proteasome accessory factor B